MKSILLVGAGRFGRHIAMQLSQLGHQIMARNESMMYCRMSPTHKSATAQTRSFFVLLVSEILMSAS